MRKAFPVLTVALATALVAAQWPDISRYIKIKQMSYGTGHPENVPAHGRAAYPGHPGGGAPDGTGDFDAASRGGPHATS
jgi:hypothetical protein